MATRRRGAVLEAAILDAAWAELEQGWSRFSVESVAERAGTGKAAVYRRWPNREALALAALVRQAAATVDSWRPSGDLRADLVEFGLVVAQAYEGPLGQAARGIVAATRPGSGLDVGAALPSAHVVSAIVAAAGLELVDDDARVSVALDAGVSLVSHHALVTGSAASSELVRTIVDDVWLPALRSVTN